MTLGKWTLAIALCITIAAPAAAQDTIALYFDDPVTGLQRFGRVPGTGEMFDIVVVMKTDAPACAAEFVMTELTRDVPGVFKTNTTKIHDTPLDLGENSLGEYMMAWGFDGCPMGELEIVRIEYMVGVPGVLQHPVALSLRGLTEDDTYPSSFWGDIGYITPADEKKILTPEVWSEYGMPDNEGLAGAVMLNPNWVPVDADALSVSEIKSRY